MSTDINKQTINDNATRIQQAEYLLLRCLTTGIKNKFLADDVRLFIESKYAEENVEQKTSHSKG